eukprot:CCRYP_003272-RA/>CCRYP_003272-RA protein AED:0.97 eAED:1.00 QI:0/0/0/0.5/1/1/2/0/317
MICSRPPRRGRVPLTLTVPSRLSLPPLLLHLAALHLKLPFLATLESHPTKYHDNPEICYHPYVHKPSSSQQLSAKPTGSVRSFDCTGPYFKKASKGSFLYSVHQALLENEGDCDADLFANLVDSALAPDDEDEPPRLMRLLQLSCSFLRHFWSFLFAGIPLEDHWLSPTDLEHCLHAHQHDLLQLTQCLHSPSDPTLLPVPEGDPAATMPPDPLPPEGVPAAAMPPDSVPPLPPSANDVPVVSVFLMIYREIISFCPTLLPPLFSLKELWRCLERRPCSRPPLCPWSMEDHLSFATGFSTVCPCFGSLLGPATTWHY